MTIATGVGVVIVTGAEAVTGIAVARGVTAVQSAGVGADGSIGVA